MKETCPLYVMSRASDTLHTSRSACDVHACEAVPLPEQAPRHDDVEDSVAF
jgi:hypothetical protein